MAILSDTKARGIKPGDKTLPHGGVAGLTLHPSGTKGRGKWVFRYVSPTTQKRRNKGLGPYPEVGIAEAGKIAQELRVLLNQGIDPLTAEEPQPEAPPTPTFSEAAAQVHADLKDGWKNAKHSAQWINTLEKFAFPTLGDMPLNAIEPRHIADVLRPIWLEKAETASRVKQRLHAVMAWGWAHGHNQANPVDVVTHLLPQQPGKTIRTQRQPAMPWQALPQFYADYFRTRKVYDATRATLLFLILTAARSGEVRGMVWSEVDLTHKLWVIPADRMKAKVQHRVPLSEAALEILRGQQGLHKELVFPSPRDAVILSDMVLTAFLRRAQALSDVEGRVATAHGFRSSFRDWCSENGFARDLAERALAHTVENKVEAAYHRTDLLEQRRPMMDAWAAFVTGKQPADTQAAR